MIAGVGVDICTIDRIERVYKKFGTRFLNRVFTQKESSYCFKRKEPFPHLAGIFAAKEAIKKAFGDKIGEIHFSKIEIIHSAYGRPEIKFYGLTKDTQLGMGVNNIHLSISHEKSLAIAIAILEDKHL